MENTLFETARLVIRPYEEKDIPFVIEFLTNPQECRYLTFPESIRTPRKIRELMTTCINSYTTDQPYRWFAVTIKGDDRWIGQFGFDVRPKETEINYSIAPHVKGEGYATECCRGGLRYLKDFVSPKQYTAFVHPQNSASIRVLEKCQFEKDTTAVPRDDGYGHVKYRNDRLN